MAVILSAVVIITLSKGKPSRLRATGARDGERPAMDGRAGGSSLD
jgi:hypothetical protein